MAQNYRDPVVMPGGTTVPPDGGASTMGAAVRRVSWGAIFAGTAIATLFFSVSCLPHAGLN